MTCIQPTVGFGTYRPKKLISGNSYNFVSLFISFSPSLSHHIFSQPHSKTLLKQPLINPQNILGSPLSPKKWQVARKFFCTFFHNVYHIVYYITHKFSSAHFPTMYITFVSYKLHMNFLPTHFLTMYTIARYILCISLYIKHLLTYHDIHIYIW